MRTLLALLIALPLIAQQPEEKKPDAAVPQAEAKPEAKPEAKADAKPAESPVPTPPV